MSIQRPCCLSLIYPVYTVINTVKKGIPEHPSWQDVYSGIMVLKPWLLYQIIPFRTMRKTIFLIKSSAISYCPVCMEELSYRDSCKRILLQEGHERHICIIRRMKCTKCGILHRELPDFLVPYKHYTAEVISGVLDGQVTPYDEDSADYPCEMTMHRWHHWLMKNTLRIDGYLRSVGHRLPGFSEELLMSGVPLLEMLRSSLYNWLETILKFIYDSGGFLVPWYSFPYAPALFCCHS